MQANFSAALAVTLAFEGGWSDNPKDPGGATMKGITLATYRRFYSNASKTQLRNISAENVARIYRQDYWQAVNGDGLAAGVDLATFDAGVMSGPARAKIWLMASIGGPDHETVKRLCAKRLGFVQALKTWVTFGRGWATRIAGIEAKGVAWALAAAGSSAPTIKAKLGDEQASAKSQANKSTTGAGVTGSGTTAAGGDALLNPQHADQVAGWVLGGLLAAGVAVAAVLVVRAIVHRRRAAAYATEADAMGVI